MTDFALRLAQALADRTDTLFGVPGGGPNLDLVGAVSGLGMRFVLAHSETPACIMAAAYGLISGSPSAAVVTRGPGAACAVNGAAQATLDRYPLVVVTDTVTAAQTPRVSHQRLDQRALFEPVTVCSATASADGADLRDLVDRAAQWPAGAVHLDYDPAVSASQTSPPTVRVTTSAAAGDTSPEGFGSAVALLTKAERPIVIVGMEAAVIDHAADGPGEPAPIRSMLETFGCPVLTTYQAIGVVPTEGAINAGLYTNGALEQAALDQADLVVMIGVDTVEPIPTPWKQAAPVITISSGPAIDDFVPADVALVGDVVALANELVEVAHGSSWKHTWPDGAAALMRTEARARLRPVPYQTNTNPPAQATIQGDPALEAYFGPLQLVDSVKQAVTDSQLDVAVTVDAGAHFLAIMPFWPVNRPFDLLISNGLATMGFSIPAAIGASLARPGRPTVAFVGDGGLSMTLAELETIARLQLPISVVVFNDSALSLIAVKQGEQHGGPSAIRYNATDFATIARANGLDGHVAVSAEDVYEIMTGSPGDWARPRLIDARIDPVDYRHIIAATRG